ncbi:hypothetical protein NDU88_007455 [Pleurodeles waltl]|uniref:Uncharacterized protein n=1 Tax=Pleurodeles waltl TaxID=8319 RepID=A0AAV7RT37_PLEWA|nr:hypothetical protein NDU88_007455 [Pleurodeles waltl]
MAGLLLLCHIEVAQARLDLAVQRDTEAPARSGRLAPGNSEAPADNFRSEPGRGWRPGPDGPVRRGGALLCRGGRTLMRGAARTPGGLLSCPCLLGWLECFPWPMAIGVLPRQRRPEAGASQLS